MVRSSGIPCVLRLIISSYSEGIRLSSTEDMPTLTSDLFRNRARTGLALCFFDNAKTDGLKALSLLPCTDGRTKELNAKALFRAASAAYSLCQYEESESLLEQLAEFAPDDQAALSLVKKIKLRLAEQTSGDYNFSKINDLRAVWMSPAS